MSRVPLPQNLNICLTANKFPLLGRAADYGFLWPIARGLSQKGHSVTVLSNESAQKSPFLEQDGVRVYYLAEDPKLSRKPFPLAVKNKFSELHKVNPFHIVHSIDRSGSLIAETKPDYKIAYAMDIKATQVSQLFAILGMAQETLGSLLSTAFAMSYKFLRTFFGSDRHLLKQADGVIVTSPIQRIVLERYYMYPDARIYTIPYGIEIGDLSPREKSAALKKELNIPDDALVVVTVTDMSEVEEVKNLLMAFEKVAIKKPNSRLIIIGHGNKRKQIEYEVYNLILGSKVIFTGAVKANDLSDHIALGDVYVNLSSRATGFEPSMLEAMAQKKVVIGSEVSAMSSIIEDNVDGFLIRPADIVSLSQLLLQFFTGQLPAQEIGENARKKMTNLFDSQKMVDETVKAYFKILRRTGYYKN